MVNISVEVLVAVIVTALLMSGGYWVVQSVKRMLRAVNGNINDQFAHAESICSLIAEAAEKNLQVSTGAAKRAEAAITSTEALVAALPELLARLAYASESQAKHEAMLAETVERLRRMLFSSTPAEQFIQYDETQPKDEMDVESLIERGIPREEAVARVREANMWKNFTVTR